MPVEKCYVGEVKLWSYGLTFCVSRGDEDEGHEKRGQWFGQSQQSGESWSNACCWD